LLAQGGREVGAGHYPLIVGLHAVWLAGLWALGWAASVEPVWLAVFLALQGMRVWVLATLGRRWTTRIIVLPDAPLVTRGPYRFMAHPNYVVVIGEIAALPLCLGMPWYALVFTIANLLVLSIRVRSENASLTGARGMAPR
jgi:methyltransferase